ncbi:hypothetical protein [Methylobacterium oxalidis]|uniref:Uncharacterized protein n=1 Tax=Methylobacterium oxalidis TaxID=944322 RepID=A0A512J176_9HYPH|nr:hypothetical protein [Methylobacterium oxalidis]GEP03685.1 hypothetical protein MOX02_17230 [Methylobacterium oxalidis]GJE33708.1 hypothetical protein LDDCCGHA_3911 [Methylobacterium oxalidis]GLS62270.1 hypothetical protein GCM10007888_06510 [Methylobacterium oxalidis]
MLQNAEAELARYQFIVYPPPVPGAPWLSVCIGPDGRVLDSEAFATFEEADLVTFRAEAVLFDSIVRQMEIAHVYAVERALH